MKKETLAIHASKTIPSTTGDVIMPISLSTTFFRGEDGGYPGGHMYSRVSNPNRQALESIMSALEHGADSCAFSSGNVAGMAVFQALAPGSHIIAPDDMYWGFRKQLLTIFNQTLTFEFVDLTNMEKLAQAIKPHTKLIWIETPSNPLLKITDIQAVAAIAKAHNITLVCDSTFASPILQNPILLGADMVMHSTTKYIGGHSDVLGGCLTTANKNQLWDNIKNIQQTGGAVCQPFEAYLLLRSIKTLPYRMKGHCENAKLITDFLTKHPKVEKVFYPGLESHPQHETAKKQMNGFGGMLSILISGTAANAKAVANSTKIFAQATSLGGVESLIEHRATVEGPGTKTPANLLRLSIGLEHPDDLIADLDQALSR